MVSSSVWQSRLRECLGRPRRTRDVVCFLWLTLTLVMSITVFVLLGSIHRCAKRSAAQPPDPESESAAIMANLDALKKAFRNRPSNSTTFGWPEPPTFYPDGQLSMMISAACFAAASFIVFVCIGRMVSPAAGLLSCLIRIIGCMLLLFGLLEMNDWYQRRGGCAGLVQAVKGSGLCSRDRICGVWKVGYYTAIAEFAVTFFPFLYVSIALLLPFLFR